MLFSPSRVMLYSILGNRVTQESPPSKRTPSTFQGLMISRKSSLRNRQSDYLTPTLIDPYLSLDNSLFYRRVPRPVASCPSKTELRRGHLHVLSVTSRVRFLLVSTDLAFLATSTVAMPFELLFGNTRVRAELLTDPSFL